MYITASKVDYKESLTDGLVLYTNPYAAVPLNAELFKDVGIRRYVANAKGGFDASFHPEGDLYFRIIQFNKGQRASWLTILLGSLQAAARRFLRALGWQGVSPSAVK